MPQIIAQVIIDVMAGEIDRPFDYLADESVQVGDLVRVPFGPQSKTGIVVGLAEESEVPRGKLRAISQVLESVLSPEMVELSAWLREQTHATWAACLRLMVPGDVRAQVHSKMVQVYSLALPLDEVLVQLSPRATGRAEVCRVLAEGPMPRAALIERLPKAAGVLSALCKAGLVAVECIAPTYHKPALPPQSKQHQPTPAQAAAIAVLRRAEGYQGFLLHGVTGSGKTQVYLDVAQSVLEQGKSVLILVPEIALTPQMVARLTGRFGDRCAVLHSGLKDSVRRAEWRRIAEGQADVVVGARSAVFCPLRGLGLVVVDEEHETTYRSDRTPCYDAVEVALWRARRDGAVAVLGSATPCLARRVMVQRGELARLALPERVNGTPMPPISVVDMRVELRDGNRSIFSRELAQALEGTLARREQAVLFINRRGHTLSVSCRNCGQAIECDKCDVSMTYHATDGQMHCHYCNARAPLPTVCPACGSKHIRTFGAGTQKVEQEVRELFPTARVARMDADTTRNREDYINLLQRLEAREIDVLVGTQMLAKGHDYPFVTLVGVVAADASLHLPDYQAQERTFALITQVAGRCGRAERPGRVVVQTYCPEHPAVAMAAAYDDEGFYIGQMARYQSELYPPFGRMLRVLYTSNSQSQAQTAAEQDEAALAAQMQGRGDWQAAVSFFAAMPAPIVRIEDRFRHVLLLHARQGPAAMEMEAFLAAHLRANRREGVLADLQLDPVQMR